ncbi:hypothetical protein ACQKWADRAFT_294542 [Trichoderma austrokoningii]
MTSINMDMMSPRSPEFFTTFVSNKGNGRRAVVESQSRHRVRNAAIDDTRSYGKHRDSYSGPPAKRLRYSEADEGADQPWSHRSSRELDSLLIEASASSRRAKSHGSTAEPSRHHLPSPPPDGSQHYRRGHVEVFPGATRARRRRDLHGIGAWSEHVALPPPPPPPQQQQQQQLLTESAYNGEDTFQSRRVSRLSIPETPRDWLLPTPDLSPMPTHYMFCPCCEHEDSRINDTWHMEGKEKMHAQLEDAMAYIEQMKLKK